MDRNYFRHDDSYGRRPRKKSNLFGWSIAILLLTGLAFAAWLGSFYIFGQPERPESYKILKKLHKIDPTKRFELTAAPAGEFLTSKQLYARYIAMSPTELDKANAELIRNYIRNYQSVRGLVPYIVGRFTIVAPRELTPNDLFTSGMVALTNAVDHGEILMEHVYPSDPQALPLMKQTLVTGLEVKLERTHDLSAVIHAERLSDGRILLTAMPLLYGSYTVTRGPGTFSLEPPLDLNLKAGWPLFSEPARLAAETHYRETVAPNRQNTVVAGLAPTTPPPAENALIRVEPAQPLDPSKVPAPSPVPSAKPSPTPKGKLAKNKKPSPTPTPSPAAPVVTQKNPALVAPWTGPAKPPTPITPPPIAGASPAAPGASPGATPDNSLASTAGGGVWRTYPPGKMPVGRLIQTSDLNDLVDRGLAGERVYLRGQFVVNFTEPNRAVLRPNKGLTDAVLHPLGGGQSVRIVVDFPAGYTPPARGATVTRDEARPYEITEVRKQSDGQINVFVREIMQ
ncbi:MAG: hypothetical protein DMF06_16885 [Verrucomicrobia bacterium]|nr:MAG: hypothetical protein DMF06_16885 [Verrucomicrobiota bacterium]